jgi:hypothetical protein
MLAVDAVVDDRDLDALAVRAGNAPEGWPADDRGAAVQV